jgi:hypothetical protein
MAIKDNKGLEEKFRKDMIKTYEISKKELNYNATRFLQIISEKEFIKQLKQLILKEDTTEGFIVLCKNASNAP